MENKLSRMFNLKGMSVRYLAWGLLGVIEIFPSNVMAQQGCVVTPIVKTYESCTGPEGTPNRRCEYRNVIDRYDISCPPVQAPTSLPPPPPVPAPPPPPISSPQPPSLERQQCLDNADSAGRKCSEAYGSAKTMCDTANTLLAGGAGRGLINLAVWKQLVSKDSKELVDAITAATGTLGFTVETVFPCNQWNSIAVGYCATGVQNLKSKCPAK